MKHLALLLALAFVARPAAAVSVDEQTRRCNIEKGSLTNKRGKEGVECLRLRAMLGTPEPPVVNNHYTSPRGGEPSAAPSRVFDPKSNRWCWVYDNGARVQCD